jgi:ATP-binding cassette subfamily B protein
MLLCKERESIMINQPFPTTTFRFIFHFVKAQKVKFIYFALTGAAWAVNDSVFPYFLKDIVNTLSGYHGAPGHIFSAVKDTLILLVAFWLVMEVLQRAQGLLQIYTYPRFRAEIRATVFEHVKTLSQEYFANNFAGNIAKKLSDLPTSCQTITEMVCFQFITVGVGMIMVVGMMWQIKPIFAFIVFAWLMCHIGITVLFLKRSNRLWAVHADSVSMLNGKIVDVLTNMSTVRLFARQRYETHYIQSAQMDEMKKSRQAMLLIELTRVGLGISGLLLIFGMVFTLLYGYGHGWVSIGDFTQVGMQTFWLLGWIWFVSYQLMQFARESGTIRNALNLVTAVADITDKANAQPLIVKQGNIDFNHVYFSYQKNKPVFNDFSVHIRAGEKVGLVGFSGSGKSTFVNLILRYYELQQGNICIDKLDIAGVTQDSLRQNIAMIPQDPSLFHRTLMENIRYGRLEASDEEVIAAAKMAHCDEFILHLDEGYQALVGERGVKLSGGQRQRIAIARAILKDAPILILDEATSALDSVTEKLIQDSLKQLMQHKTTLAIAHRLSTLNGMDRILVFHHGRIIEEGTQAELLQKKGHFAHLWQMQSNGFLPEEETESDAI